MSVLCVLCRSYAAPELLQLGWARPIQWLRGKDFQPGSWLSFQLPALVDTPVNTLVRVREPLSLQTVA